MTATQRLDYRDQLLALLRELAFEEREVTLSSGLKSNFYIDCKKVTLRAEGHHLVGRVVFAEIQRVAPQARAVGGLTLGADPIASAVSLQSFISGDPVDAFIIRKESKGHGTDQWIEGADHLPRNSPVVVVEDVVTTGASTLRAVERARAAGLDVVHVVALVDRQEGGRQAVERVVPLTALFCQQDFFA